MMKNWREIVKWIKNPVQRVVEPVEEEVLDKVQTCGMYVLIVSISRETRTSIFDKNISCVYLVITGVYWDMFPLNQRPNGYGDPVQNRQFILSFSFPLR